MKMVPVDSSTLTAVGYDPATQVLEAAFTNGAVWRYHGVPRKVYEELMAGGSIGGYMRDFVIDVYRDERVRRR